MLLARYWMEGLRWVAMYSSGCHVACSVPSVPLLCWEAMELSATTSVGLMARPKNRKVPTTCCMNLICSDERGGVSSVLFSCLVEPHVMGMALYGEC